MRCVRGGHRQRKNDEGLTVACYREERYWSLRAITPSRVFARSRHPSILVLVDHNTRATPYQSFRMDTWTLMVRGHLSSMSFAGNGVRF